MGLFMFHFGFLWLRSGGLSFVQLVLQVTDEELFFFLNFKKSVEVVNIFLLRIIFTIK